MTATLAALKEAARPDQDANLRPIPWRRMAWVIWRQHRTALTGLAVLLIAISVGFWVIGLRLHHAYIAAISCHPASSLACNDLVNTFNGMYGFLANGLILQVVPPLTGAFLGASVLARELEDGTFRFAWTQGLGRWRWTLAKIVSLGLILVAGVGAITVLLSWYYRPYFPATSHALYVSKETAISVSSPFSVGLFDVRGVTFAAWTLAAFAIGVLFGVILRRVVPAILATLVVYTGLAFAAGGFLRQHYVAPVVTSRLNIPDSAWVVAQQWLTKSGKPASQSAINALLLKAPGQLFGKGGVPKSVTVWEYLARHGYTQLTTYQPASRFWPFQWIEGGGLFALSVLCLAVSVWLVRRRVA